MQCYAGMDNFIDQTLVLLSVELVSILCSGERTTPAHLRDVHISLKLQHSSAKKAGVAHTSKKS